MASKLVTLLLLSVCAVVALFSACPADAATKTYKIFTTGNNAFGQLGTNGTTDSVGVPIEVVDGGLFKGKVIQQVAAGRFHSLALVDGKVYTWGLNEYGQLGDGTTESRYMPTAVTGDITSETVTFIASGGNHSVAVTDTGKVYTWGFGGYGNLCHGNLINYKTPTLIQMTQEMSNTTVVQLSTGYYDTVMLTEDGRLFGCGRNHYGQLGDGTLVDKSLPVAVNTSGVLAGKKITLIQGGLFHSVAVDEGGHVYAWGFNAYGQLGDGTLISKSLPIAITSDLIAGKQFVDVAIGYHTTGLTTTGELYAWGFNGFGQLGDGTNVSKSSPIAVNTDGVLKSKNIVKIDATHNVLALDSDGAAYCWGFNRYGMCGDGTTSQSNILLPKAVSTTGALSGGKVIDISTADGFHSMFITTWEGDASTAAALPTISTMLVVLLSAVLFVLLNF